jgi:hypothetical protein
MSILKYYIGTPKLQRAACLIPVEVYNEAGKGSLIQVQSVRALIQLVLLLRRFIEVEKRREAY